MFVRDTLQIRSGWIQIFVISTAWHSTAFCILHFESRVIVVCIVPPGHSQIVRGMLHKQETQSEWIVCFSLC